MPFSPINQRLIAGQRPVFRNGTLSVENETKYEQRSCFSKFVHRKQYDSKKILAFLQSFYSKSLTEDEAKCLKKNIRATLRLTAEENVKTVQMNSFTRWLFHKHVVDLKPYAQTFEKLQSITFRPKWQEQKEAYNKLKKTNVNKAAIQAGMKALNALKQLHRPTKDIQKINALVNKYKQLQGKLIALDPIKVILDNVKQFPSQTPCDLHYPQKANVTLEKAKLELEKIQKNLSIHSATYQQIQEELAALEKAHQSLNNGFKALCMCIGAIIPLMQKKHVSLKDFLFDDALFASEKEKLEQLSQISNPPIKYDLISKFIEKIKNNFDVKYDGFKKSFDFDDFVAEMVTKNHLQLIAEFKSKYPVNTDFTKNTEAIHKMAESIRLLLHIDMFLPKSYSHHDYYSKLAAIIEEKKVETQKELFVPFFQVLTHIPLIPSNDLEALSSNLNTLKKAKKHQYRFLKVCDPNKDYKKFVKEKLQEINANLSQIFSNRTKKIKELSEAFQKKFTSPIVTLVQAQLYLKEREETFLKMRALAEQHKKIAGMIYVPINSSEKKMQEAIDQFTNDTKKTEQFINADLMVYRTMTQLYAYPAFV